MRNLSSPAIFVIVLVAFLSSVLLGGVGFAQNLAQELGETQQDVANKKKIIRQLSLKERALHKDLAKIENELSKRAVSYNALQKKKAAFGDMQAIISINAENAKRHTSTKNEEADTINTDIKIADEESKISD